MKTRKIEKFFDNILNYALVAFAGGIGYGLARITMLFLGGWFERSMTVLAIVGGVALVLVTTVRAVRYVRVVNSKFFAFTRTLVDVWMTAQTLKKK